MSILPNLSLEQIKPFLTSLATPNPQFERGQFLPLGYKPIFEKYQHIFIPIINVLIDDNDPQIFEKIQNIFFEIIKEILENRFLLEDEDIDSLIAKTPKVSHPFLPPDHLKCYQIYVISQIVEKEVNEFLLRFGSRTYLGAQEPDVYALKSGGISQIGREAEWKKYRERRFERSWENAQKENSIISKPSMPICTYQNRESYFDHVMLYINNASHGFLQDESQEAKNLFVNYIKGIFSTFQTKYQPLPTKDPNYSCIEEDHLLFLSACMATKILFLNDPKDIFRFFSSLQIGINPSLEEMHYWSSLELWFLRTLGYLT
jgi:hypothetical protein